MAPVSTKPRRRLDAPENMSHGPQQIGGKVRREPFVSGWTGRITVALFAYTVAAILLTFVDGEDSRVFEILNLYSDSPASILAAILAAAAARGSSDPAARRTWWLLTAALACYSAGNLLHATYWLFDVDPFPSIGDVFYLAFYPLVFAAVLTVVRAAAVRVQWARLALDSAILLLGFGGFFWFFVIAPTAASPARRRPAPVRAGAELHRDELRGAARVRRAADALGRRPDPAAGPRCC